MELVTVLRVLARRRGLLVLGVLAALAAGCVAGGTIALGPFAAPERRASEAFTQIQLDTPKSLLVDLGASNATIGTQTRLLASAMPKSGFLTELARAAGISPRQLTVVARDAREPPRVSPLAVRAAEVAATPATPYVLVVSASTDVPVISIRVSGPDLDKVGRLTRAPVTLLRSFTAAQAPSASRTLSVRTLTPATFEEGAVSGGRRLVLAALVFVLFSVAWAAALVIVAGVARAWRRSGAEASLDAA